MAIGKAIVFENRDKYKTPIKTTANANEEINNFTNALPVAIEKIEILKRKLTINLPKDELEIFESYSAMVNDPEVIEKTISLIDNYNCNADFAYYEISKEFIETLEQIDDPYLKQRAEDLKMISKMIIEILQCWTVGPIFTFGRSRMFGPEKLRPSAVDRSRSRRIKNFSNICRKS